MNQIAQQISSLINDKKFQQALSLCQQALAQHPKQAGFLTLAGQASCHAGNFQQGQAYFSAANQTAPSNLSILDIQGSTYTDTRHINDAIIVFEKRLAIQPSAETFNNLGFCYLSIENWDEAKKYLNEAISLNPDLAIAYYNLGVIEKFHGNFDTAANYLSQSIALDPDYIVSYTSLLECKHITSEDDPIIQKIKYFIENEEVTEEHLMLYHILSEAYDKLDNPEMSFHMLKVGNDKIRNLKVNYHTNNDKKLFNRIKTTLTKEFFDTHSDMGISDVSPVFITGMPRSGTTLVEQILSSHPLVHGAGEINTLSALIQNYGLQEQYPLRLLSLDKEKIQALANDYLNKVSTLSPNESIITNKHTINIYNVGLIKLLFPNARIIHCQRNPIDTCFSIYKKKFIGSYPYSYNLEELGHYYLMYQDLMKHWANTLPGFMLELDYEKLVSNQEEQTRRLLDYCDLEWNDACLEFYNNKRAVKTASFAQVRKPIYKSSIKAWEKYKEQLKPLIDILESGQLPD